MFIIMYLQCHVCYIYSGVVDAPSQGPFWVQLYRLVWRLFQHAHEGTFTVFYYLNKLTVTYYGLTGAQVRPVVEDGVGATGSGRRRANF